MRVKLLLFTLLIISLGACSLFGGPSATVKRLMTAAQKGDSETMTKLFSSKAVQKIGIDKIRANNESFAETTKRAYEADSSYSMRQVTETKTGDTARVSFFYQNQKRTDSIHFVFDLIKENGEWKIDDVGGADKEETKTIDEPFPSPSLTTKEETRTSKEPFQASPTLKPSILTEGPEAPPPPPKPTAEVTPRREPISGGVLNGKATSLPKPAYPPAAKAVKASGAVVVQVLLDESGKVVTASAVSGHPLLRATAVSAAYSAKFSPTRLAGQPVKVKGVIIYNFVPE